MRTFITGSKGQLGSEFVRLFDANGWEYRAADLDELDISSPDDVMDAIMAYRPALIINCAAYNQVDKAESEPVAAAAVNAKGPKNLALAAKKLESKLVHFGTDYVFDGGKRAPYEESDATNPPNVYGRTKLEGEKEAFQSPGALVFRLSWVYGRGSQNFMHKLRAWAGKEGPLRIVNDEVSVPTCTIDIVSVVMEALGRGLTGLWHLTAGGSCSRYEWAETALRAYGIKKEILPAKMADFSLPARRAEYSAMSNSALSRELGIRIPNWKESVEKFIGESE